MSQINNIITSSSGELVFQQTAPLPNEALKSIDFITLVDILSEGEIELSATAHKNSITDKTSTAYKNSFLKDLFLNNQPVLGVIGVPKKDRIFYSYGKNNSYMLEKEHLKKLSCEKITPKGQVLALTNHINPSEIILEKLKQYGTTSFRKLSSSYKYCVIANGEYDLYADQVRAKEWDDAAGHAIAEAAGAIVTTLEDKSFKYGNDDYKNPTILIRRSKNLND